MALPRSTILSRRTQLESGKVTKMSESDLNQRVRLTIRILEGFLSKANKIRISPVPIIFETLIDLLLELKQALKEESFSPKENLELIFLDFEAPDELGNSRQRRQRVPKVRAKPSTWYEPEAGPSIDQLVSLFIEAKSGTPVKEAFMALLSKYTVPVLRTESLESTLKRTPKGANKVTTVSRRNRTGYWSRRKRRSRKRSNVSQ